MCRERIVTTWCDSHSPKSSGFTRTLQNIFAAALLLPTTLLPKHNTRYTEFLGFFQKYIYPKNDCNTGVHMKVKWAIGVIIMTVTEVEITISGE